MDRFTELFGRDKPASWNERVLLPVVHVEAGNEFETGLRGAMTAYESWADGVFLIEMSGATYHGKMTDVARDIRRVFTSRGIDFPVGVNYLNIAHEPDLPIYEAERLGHIPMIWSDNPGGRHVVEGARNVVVWDGVYFGAVAFKCQTPVSLAELPDAARAAQWMDVLTSSGENTGVAIDLEKARIFAESVTDSIRAVASGVSIENIKQILPYFHAFLVSTSINLNYHTLDPRKTKELAKAIHGWRPSD